MRALERLGLDAERQRVVRVEIEIDPRPRLRDVLEPGEKGIEKFLSTFDDFRQRDPPSE